MNRVLLCAASLILAHGAVTGQIVVSNTNNGGSGSLRAAINAANNMAGADTIVMQAGLVGTINLTSSLPTITGPLTINGDSDGNPCTKEITVSGGDAVRIMSINDVSVTLEDITLQDGSAGANGTGGAINFTGTSLNPLLTLTRSCFISNQAGDGGAVNMNAGDLRVTDCLFDQNTTLIGALQAEQGAALRFDTSISAPVTFDIINSTFTNNTSQSAGGALLLRGVFTTFNITGCLFRGNQNTTFFGGGAMAVLENAGSNFDVDLNISDCQFDNNTGISGGALRVSVGGSGPLDVTIENSTFHSNVGTIDGGAMNVFGGSANKNVVIRNSTFSGNSAGSGVTPGVDSAFAGAGTICMANLTLDSCTIMNNAGMGSNTFGAGVVGGFDVFAGNLTLTNTIFADNTGVSTGSQDAEALRHSGSGTFTDGDHNLIDDTLDLELGGLTGSNNILNVNPNIAALTDTPRIVGVSFDGDLMEVRFPNAGSPVINAGGTSLGSDQIGSSRPGGASDDIGALEGVVVPTFQANQPAASLDINGVMGTAMSAAFVTGPASAFYTLNASTSMPAMPFDIAVWPGAPAFGPLSTQEGQLVHVDLCSPSVTYFIGQAMPNTTLPFNTAFPFPFSFQVGPVDVSAQMFVIDPTRADGISLSQVVHLVTF